MMIQRIARVAAIILMLVGPALVLPELAQAAGKPNPSKTVKKGGKYKNISHHKRRGRKGRGKFSGRLASAAELRTEPLPKPSGKVHLRSVNFKEEVEVQIYNEDGTFNQQALAKLDHLFRCRRTGEERAVDPRLYEMLSVIYDKYGKRIELNSGFRYQRNEGSRHFHGSAMDIQIPGVSMHQLYTFAQTLDAGGMGIGRYPHSGFVHIDFRAPGEPSYRWADTQRTRKDPGKAPSRMWRRSTRPSS
jgi:uncharacterized protein YcbK (DUF882 family)